jgi:hypothetical protein
MLRLGLGNGELPARIMLASHVDALGIWNLELRGGMEMSAVRVGWKSTSKREMPVHPNLPVGSGPAGWFEPASGSGLLNRRGLVVAVAAAWVRC